MFPSTNTNNPFEFSSYKRSSSPALCEDYQTPKLQDLDDPFFFAFPSPFFDEHESPLNQILPRKNEIMTAGGNGHHVQKNGSGLLTTKKGKSTKRGVVASGTGDTSTPIVTRRRNLGVVPRKRTGKKDRHSKICTAQGIRDRRMRLSLQVARKFFDLQDMLGYDKASKTIEWLFTKSKKAIKELVQDHPIQANVGNICNSEAKSESFVSECEVVSGIDHQENSNANTHHEVKEGILPTTNLVPLCNIISSPFEITRDPEMIKPRKRPAIRESRDKARARARCRTIEKMMIKGLDFSSQSGKSLNPNLDNDVHKLGPCANSPFEGVEQESRSINIQERVSSYGTADFTSLDQEQILGDVGTIEKFLKGSSSRSCPNICDFIGHCPVAVSSCIDSNFMGLICNLDMNSTQYSVTNQVSLAGILTLI